MIRDADGRWLRFFRRASGTLLPERPPSHLGMVELHVRRPGCVSHNPNIHVDLHCRERKWEAMRKHTEGGRETYSRQRELENWAMAALLRRESASFERDIHVYEDREEFYTLMLLVHSRFARVPNTPIKHRQSSSIAAVPAAYHMGCGHRLGWAGRRRDRDVWPILRSEPCHRSSSFHRLDGVRPAACSN